jgi:uncharacterized membrane protein YqjE
VTAAGESDGRTRGGLFESLRVLLTTLVAVTHTRVELIGNELESELRRVVAVLIGAMAVLALSGLALLFGALLVVAAFWDTHRLEAVAAVATGFGAMAVLALYVARQRGQRPTGFLAATLGELTQDGIRLRAAPPAQ